MSTTLVPEMQYLVKPLGRSPRVYPTIADLAAAIVWFSGRRMQVGAVMGRRTRPLTEVELNELREHVQAARFRSTATSTPARRARQH